MLALVLCLASQATPALTSRPEVVPLVVRTRAAEGLPAEVALAVSFRRWDATLVPASELEGPVLHVVPGTTLETTLEVPDDVVRPYSVWVQVAEPGLQQQRAFCTRTAKKDGLECFLALQTGGTLFGAVRSTLDAGDGCVRLAGPAGSPWTRVLRGGGFALHFAKGGRYDLAAFVPGGRALLRGLALEPFAPPQVVTLDTPPGSTISGRVLDPDGVPVVPYEVAAVPVGFESPDGGLQGAWTAMALGEPVAVDSEGRFALRHLPPGEHVLFGCFGREDPKRLGASAVPAGASDVTLTAFVRRLAVSVLDAEGNAVNLTPPVGLEHSRHRLSFERLDGYDFVGGAVARATAVIRRVEAGTRWRITYASLGSPPVARTRTIPEEPWLVRETLQAAPPTEPAELRVRFENEEHPDGYHVEAWTADGLNAALSRLHSGNEPILLAPGAYRIQVIPISWLMCWDGNPEDLVPALGPIAFDVELAPGQKLERRLVLPPNRRLAIDLAGPRQGDASSIGMATDWQVLHEAIGAARVTLREVETGLELHPEFSVDLCDSDLPESRCHLCLEGIAPGRRSVSVTGIAPGRYAMIVELSDGRRLEREVDLQGPDLVEFSLP